MIRKLLLGCLLLVAFALVACEEENESPITDQQARTGPPDIAWQRPQTPISSENVLSVTLTGLLVQHRSALNSIQFSADNDWMLTHSRSDRWIQLWDLTDGTATDTLRDVDVRRVFLAPDMAGLVLATDDKRLQYRPLEDGDGEFHEVEISLERPGPAAQAILPVPGPADEVQRFAFGDFSGNVQLFSGFPLVERGTIEAFPVAIDDVLFTPDGERVVVRSHFGEVEVWDFETLESLHLFTGFTSPSRQIILSPDGQQLVAVLVDSIQVWDLTAFTLLREMEILPESAGERLQISPDGQHLAVVGEEDTLVSVWDIAQGKLLVSGLDHPAEVTGLVFDNESQLLFSSVFSRNVLVWDLATITATEGTEQVSIPQFMLSPGYSNEVEITTLRLSPDGTLLVSADTEGLIYTIGVPPSSGAED